MLPHEVIRKPVITEKSMKEVSRGRYTFAVDRRASKGAIAIAVKALFLVDPVKVQVVTVPGKRRRTGKKRIQFVFPRWKKAVVTLKPDQKIAIFEAPGKNGENP